jgi:hypothetical protein
MENNIYYISPSQQIIDRMERHLGELLKELELLKAEHPGLTERTDEEAE